MVSLFFNFENQPEPRGEGGYGGYGFPPTRIRSLLFYCLAFRPLRGLFPLLFRFLSLLSRHTFFSLFTSFYIACRGSLFVVWLAFRDTRGSS